MSEAVLREVPPARDEMRTRSRGRRCKIAFG